MNPAYGPSGWWKLCSTACAAVVVEALLRSRSLPETCKLLGIELGKGVVPPTRDSEPLVSAHASVRANVETIYTWLPLPDSCLRRALTAGFSLRAERPQLVIGVRKSHHLDAHAWLVTRGAIIDWSDKHHEYAPIR